MDRRAFLRSTVGCGMAVVAGRGWTRALGQATATQPAQSQAAGNPARLPTRQFGTSDVRLSVIGFGSFMLRDHEPAAAARLVAESVERGVNYFDVAPSYGKAEELLGPALRPYRKDAFLACKTARRDRQGAAEELQRSLDRLQTDHLDLYQLHHITDVAKDVEAAFAKDGAMEVLIQAKKEGKVRFLGFSAHSVEAALAAMDRYDFDSALVPINFAAHEAGRFDPPIVAKAREKGVNLLAIKPMARQLWPDGDPQRDRYPICWYQPITDRHEADLALRFTLSQPVVAAVPPASESLYRMALDLGMQVRPISPAERDELKALAGTLRPVFARS